MVQLEDALEEAARRLESTQQLAGELERLRNDNDRLRAELALLRPEPVVADVANPRLVLEVTDPDGAERTVRFDQDLVAIGRDAGCDLVLGDEGAGATHAVIEVGQDRAEIVDRGAFGGTSVNGERVTRLALSTSDVIRIGDTTLTVWLSP